MASSDDDEDLKRAIALSLREEGNSGQQRGQSFKDAITLGSETEDEDIPQASTNLAWETATTSDEKDPAPSAGLGLLGLDRKKMEQERLARKRKVSISPPPPRKVPRISAHTTLVSPTLVSQSTTDTTSKGHSPAGLQFPRGTVKKTWAFGYPRVGDDIKVEEVFQKQDLSLAVLSSFQWDVEWLLAKINTRSMVVPLLLHLCKWGLARPLRLTPHRHPYHTGYASQRRGDKAAIPTRDSLYVESTAMLSINGWPSQLHAFQTHAALTSYTSTRCHPYGQLGSLRLG